MNFARKMTIIIAIVVDALFLISCNIVTDDITIDSKGGHDNSSMSMYYCIANGRNNVIAITTETISENGVGRIYLYAHIFDYNVTSKSVVQIGPGYYKTNTGLYNATPAKFVMRDSVGFLVTSTFVYRTTDNGLSWQNVLTYNWRVASSIDCDYDGETVIVCIGSAFDYNNYISHNNGASWSTNNNIGNGVGINGDTIVSVKWISNKYLVTVSHDRGVSFSTVDVGLASTARRIVATDSCIVALIANNGIIISKDNGTSWVKYQNINHNNNHLVGVKGKLFLSFYTSSTNGSIYCTDTGENFTPIVSAAVDCIAYDGQRLFYSPYRSGSISYKEINWYDGITKASDIYYHQGGGIIRLESFIPNTSVSPVGYCNKNGQVEYLRLVSPRDSIASTVQVKTIPTSYHARLVLGNPNDGVLAIAKYTS